MSAGKTIVDRPLMTGWRPSDRNDLVVCVMDRMEDEWIAANDVRAAIEADSQLRMWWDYLPTYVAWDPPQKIGLSAQNVESRMRHLHTYRRVLVRRTHDNNGNYCGVTYALLTTERREAMMAALRERLRIPADLREEAFVSAGALGLEVETRVRQADDPAWDATAELTVRTKRGEVTTCVDVEANVADAVIRNSWVELLVDVGLRSRPEDE